jgi:hypothetical protein
MRLSPFFAATVAALVVITWFLWPFAAVPKDPVGSALAAVRALIFFLVTLGATNVVAGHLPVPLGQLHQAASRSELLLQLALVFPSVSICS